MEDSIETILRRIGSTGFCSMYSKNPPKLSILKHKTCVDKPTAESIPVRIHSSFLSVRSSISDEKSQLVQRRLSELVQEGVDIISDEDLNVSYLDLPTEEDNISVEPEGKPMEKPSNDSLNEGNDKQTEEDVEKDDLMEMYEEADDDSIRSEVNDNNTDNEDGGSENDRSKAVQKGWMLNEDAFDKSIQAEGSRLVSACTQTDECSISSDE